MPTSLLGFLMSLRLPEVGRAQAGILGSRLRSDALA